MKRIFIYYSLSGNGDIVAETLKNQGIDIRKVIVKDELPKKRFFQIMTGGFLAFLNHKSELVEFNEDVSSYDEVIIGSPVWNGRLSCPINTVLDKIDLTNKKIKFILCSGSGTALKLEKKLLEKYNNIEIINLKEPKRYKEEINKLKESTK